MKRTVVLSLTGLGALTIGMISGVALVFFNPFAKPAHRVEAFTHTDADGRVNERFVFNTATDSIATTHQGNLPLPPQPKGISLLSEPANEHGLVVLTKIRDARNEIVGFATQSESVLEGSNPVRGIMQMRTEWTVVIPSRGSIFLSQIESTGELGKQVMPTVMTGGTWDKVVKFVTTAGPLANGNGRIVGGTGEFEGITGEFVEVNQLRRWSLKDGLDATGELQLSYTLPAPGSSGTRRKP